MTETDIEIEKKEEMVSLEKKEEMVSEETKSTKSQKIALFCGFLSLILIVIFAYFAFTYYKQNNAIVASQQMQLTQLTDKLSVQASEQNTQFSQTQKIKSTLEAQVKQVTSQLQTAKNDSKIIKTDIQALQRSLAATTIRHPNDWILAEVEYLLQLTGRKIWLEKDIKTAISLLVAADQRIVELNDASLSSLRSALFEDINMLEALPKRDPDGVILVLTSLEKRIEKLRSVNLIVSETKVSEQDEVSTDINDWDNNLLKSWDEFIESFITINKRDDKIEALLSPEQNWYLQENIRNNLAKAEFAIYREQQTVYDIALENTLSLLKNYYDLKDNGTEHFYNSIQRLSKRKVSIKYPDQLKSTSILERVVEQRLQKSLASSTLK